MNRTPAWLMDFKSDVYSQSGEDGIIGKILEVLPESDKWCVEFGAWDGQYHSNARNLIENKGYSAVLIEGDRTKFKDLQKNFSKNMKVTVINRFVGFDGEYSLDNILKETPIPTDFDFLLIDIDGNDYHVWKSISDYKPKVICIEFNPTIPTNIKFVQTADASVNQGASLLSLVELGKEKGYELVSVLDFNAFFVRRDFYQLFRITDNSPEVMRTNLDDITYLFSGYDGRVFLSGKLRLPWHGVGLKESKFQPLPRFLRKYPENYSNAERIMFGVWLIFSDTHLFIIETRRAFQRLIKRLS